MEDPLWSAALKVAGLGVQAEVVGGQSAFIGSQIGGPSRAWDRSQERSQSGKNQPGATSDRRLGVGNQGEALGFIYPDNAKGRLLASVIQKAGQRLKGTDAPVAHSIPAEAGRESGGTSPEALSYRCRNRSSDPLTHSHPGRTRQNEKARQIRGSAQRALASVAAPMVVWESVADGKLVAPPKAAAA